jgi:hypothetical protein
LNDRLRRLAAVPDLGWAEAALDEALMAAAGACPPRPVPGNPELVDCEPMARAMARAIGDDEEEVLADVRAAFEREGRLVEP